MDRVDGARSSQRGGEGGGAALREAVLMVVGRDHGAQTCGHSAVYLFNTRSGQWLKTGQIWGHQGGGGRCVRVESAMSIARSGGGHRQRGGAVMSVGLDAETKLCLQGVGTVKQMRHPLGGATRTWQEQEGGFPLQRATLRHLGGVVVCWQPTFHAYVT